MEPKFESKEAYLRWCSDVVQRLYSARICMNAPRVHELLRDVDQKLHLSEGQEIYP